MKAREVRDMSNEELAQRLDETQREILNLRIQQSSGQLEVPSRLRALRRDIARIHTVRTERKKEAN